MSRYTVVTCKCCGHDGPHGGWGLRTFCYGRLSNNGGLDAHKTAARRDRIWAHTNTAGRYEDYLELRANGITKKEHLADRLGVSERTIERYRAVQRSTQALGQREAA